MPHTLTSAAASAPELVAAPIPTALTIPDSGPAGGTRARKKQKPNVGTKDTTLPEVDPPTASEAESAAPRSKRTATQFAEDAADIVTLKKQKIRGGVVLKNNHLNLPSDLSELATKDSQQAPDSEEPHVVIAERSYLDLLAMCKIFTGLTSLTLTPCDGVFSLDGLSLADQAFSCVYRPPSFPDLELRFTLGCFWQAATGPFFVYNPVNMEVPAGVELSETLKKAGKAPMPMLAKVFRKLCRIRLPEGSVASTSAGSEVA